jgi:hypothetical protein
MTLAAVAANRFLLGWASSIAAAFLARFFWIAALKLLGSGIDLA